MPPFLQLRFDPPCSLHLPPPWSLQQMTFQCPVLSGVTGSSGIYVSHTQPQLLQPAICLALHTCGLGVSMDLPGSLWTLALLTSPGLTAVSGRCLLPTPLTLRSPRCPS